MPGRDDARLENMFKTLAANAAKAEEDRKKDLQVILAKQTESLAKHEESILAKQEEMGQQLDQKIQSLRSELEMPTLRAKVNEHSDTLAALNSTVEVLKGSEGMIRALNGCTKDAERQVNVLCPFVAASVKATDAVAYVKSKHFF